MPELTALHIAMLVAAVAVGATAAWVLRGNRSAREKAAVSAGWQEQIDAQRREHERLVDQNKSLMDQVSQFKAQHTDAKNRARELSVVVQEAFQRRDELQREIKDIRGNLETVLSERDQLAVSVQARSDDEDLLRQKDQRIEKLTTELKNWQNRLPPLIERFRVRNEEAERLEAELADARERILELERPREADGTHIEAMQHPGELTAGRDACNDAADASATGVDAAPGNGGAPLVDDDDGAYPAAPRDDLKMIKGVGPAIEKTLNELGIFSLRQIADMSEYDIDRVARRLKGFHSRIHREDWIGQARTLLDEAARA